MNDIFKEKIEEGLRALAKIKAAGLDFILAKLLKWGNDPMVNELTKIANIVLYPVKVPDEWKCEAIVNLSEKEDLCDCDHWRGITRGVATQGARGAMPLPHFNFLTKQGPKVSVSNIRDIAFLQMFRNYTDQKFHNFYSLCYIFWTNYGDFPFFSSYIGEIIRSLRDHLLKRFDT